MASSTKGHARCLERRRSVLQLEGQLSRWARGSVPVLTPPPPACFHVQNPMRRSRTCGGPFPAVSPGEGGLQPAGGHSRTKGQCHPVAGLSPLPVTRTGEKGATGRPRHFLRMERRELLPCRLTPQLLRTPQLRPRVSVPRALLAHAAAVQPADPR